MRRRLGPLRWARLHKLVYVIGLLAVVHFLLRVKRDVDEPMMYGYIVVALLGVRLWHASNKKQQRAEARGEGEL